MIQEENGKKQQIVGLSVQLPNFYQPSTFLNPKKTDTKDPIYFPQPKNGEYFDVEEMRNLKFSTVFDRAEYPEKGGLFVYLRHYKYPIRGFPVLEMVKALGLVKGIIPVWIELLVSMAKNPLCWFSLKKIAEKSALRLIENIYKSLQCQIPLFPEKANLFCQSVREVYRVMTETFKMPELGSSEESESFGRPLCWDMQLVKLRNILCFGLELDNAYRYRFQDIVGELNKEEFMKNPRKEILRLMDLEVSRENQSNMKEKFAKIRKLLSLYLMVDRKIINKLKEIVKNLNIDEVKLQEDDIYFCNGRVDYNFLGIKR